MDTSASRSLNVLGTILEIPTFIFFITMKLTVPVLAVFMDIIIVLSITFFPLIVVFRALQIYTNISITSQTSTFIILVVGSFLLVYCPRYISKVINRITILLDFNERSFKQQVADFMMYIYDANTIKFFINCIYVVFVGIICIKQFQYNNYLIDKATDSAVMNAFIVFLAFDGIRSSFKDIRISAFAFLEKLIKIL